MSEEILDSSSGWVSIPTHENAGRPAAASPTFLVVSPSWASLFAAYKDAPATSVMAMREAVVLGAPVFVAETPKQIEWSAAGDPASWSPTTPGPKIVPVARELWDGVTSRIAELEATAEVRSEAFIALTETHTQAVNKIADLEAEVKFVRAGWQQTVADRDALQAEAARLRSHLELHGILTEPVPDGRAPFPRQAMR